MSEGDGGREGMDEERRQNIRLARIHDDLGFCSELVLPLPPANISYNITNVPILEMWWSNTVHGMWDLSSVLGY